MTIEAHVSSPESSWMVGQGEAADVVISSRARLARNLAGYNFTGRLAPEGAEEVLQTCSRMVGKLGRGWDVVPLTSCAPLDRQVLVEKHLMSPDMAHKVEHRGLGISEDESQSIMINEEDHLRLQAFVSGLCPMEAWRMVDETDNTLEKDLTFAFDGDEGYLTACPTNMGTGLRVSIMAHLQGLVMTRRAGQLLPALSKLGIAIRGLYGEGTEAVGNVFQLSNEVTLGQSEEEIVEGVLRVARQVVDQERSARSQLASERLTEVKDRVFRAYALLRYAQLISADEALSLLSDVRLGVEMGLLKKPTLKAINALHVVSLPAYLSKAAGRDLGKTERLELRAALIRETLAKEGES